MILIIEKQITGRYATLLIDIQKPMINIWKITIIIKNFHILNIGMQIIFMVGHKSCL